MSRLLKPLALLALGFVLVSLPFYRILLYTDRVLLYRDLSRDFLSQKAIWANAVRAGEGIPYWNYFSFGGTPYLAQNVSSPLHPLNAIFLLASPANYAKALAIFIWAHYLIFCAGTYFLLRTKSMRPLVALLFASALTLSGYLMSAHNLLHIICSLPAVPFFFAFWGRYLHRRRLADLLAAAFALAWPIYGGDPQYTYVLAWMGLALAIRHAWKRRGEWLAAALAYGKLGCLSLAAAAAQLLPTFELTLRTDRGSQRMDVADGLLFSHHPLRFLEMFYPRFFGNRYGREPYWAEEFVNFPAKTPFIFSTYTGALVIFFLLLWGLAIVRAPARLTRTRAIFPLAIAFGLIVCMGEYAPFPAYEWLHRWLPGFGYFRYPERLLFWPLFGIWWIAALHAAKTSRATQIVPVKGGHARSLLGPIGGVAVSLCLAIAIYFRWLGFPLSSLQGIAIFCVSIAAYALVAFLVLRGKLKLAVALAACLAIQAAELFVAQRPLIWDQSIHITDIRRYPVAEAIVADLKAREADLRQGAARRMSPSDVEIFVYLTDKMDHATKTTFNAYESLVANAGPWFGIEDITGYYSLIPKELGFLWDELSIEKPDGFDHRRIYDLFGVYYLPQRGDSHAMSLGYNKGAIPYLSVPRQAIRSDTVEETVAKLKSREKIAADTIYVAAAPETMQMHASFPSSAHKFSIQERNGRKFAFTYEAAADVGPHLILWNEGFDRNWRATADQTPVKTYRANAWAMAIAAPAMRAGKPVRFEFVYESAWILWGQRITLVFLLAVVVTMLNRKRC